MKKQIIGVLLVALSGCHVAGTATLVRSTHSWGELTLSGTYLDRVADATVLMATHCDGPFAVVDHDSESGFTQTPGPDQTRIQFVCPARVETRRFARARQRTAGGERPTNRALVIPGSVTPASAALDSATSESAAPASVESAAAQPAESPAPTSPALALSPPMPSQTTRSSSDPAPPEASPPPPEVQAPSD